MDSQSDALYTAAQSRAIDQALMAAGIPGIELMNRAGHAALKAFVSRWPGADDVTLVCGSGNNGGDGFVFARLARDVGIRPRVLLVGEADRIAGDARLAFEAMIEAGVPAEPFDPGALTTATVLVDALFGTGLDREVVGLWREAIEAINASAAPVLALDLPSGLHADSGAVLGTAVQATATVTFIVLKRGMFTHQGPDHCGEIVFDDLGAPPELVHAHPPACRLLSFPPLGLARRRRESHKGDFGHVLVIGGDAGYSGAARLAAEAALRCGAGLVSVATRREHAALLHAGRPEIMVHGVERAAELAPLLHRATVVAVGPGLGRGGWGWEMIEGLDGWTGPLVVDADALLHIARLRRYGDPERRVFTPHPGEAARLLGVSAAQVQADRFQALSALAALAQGHWLLKGCGSLLVSPGETPWLSPLGNPGMASGGMGDVLTGVIAGILAQAGSEGWGTAEAVRLAVSLHGHAGDQAAGTGERGLLASDLLPHLRAGMNP